MSKIKILGVDAGLRNLGFAAMTYCEESKTKEIVDGAVLQVPQKYKGYDAILYMKNQIQEFFAQYPFNDAEKIIIEIPKASFGPAFQSWALMPVAVVAGIVVASFDIERLVLVAPSEWNKTRKKEKTHEMLEVKYGNPENWGYIYPPKNKKHLEHIFDAVGMAAWYIEKNYELSDT